MRLGSFVYWCKYKGVNEYDCPIYDPPIKIVNKFNYFTCQPISEWGDIKAFGDNSSSTWKIMMPEQVYDKIYKMSRNDVLYIDGAIPNITADYVNGDGANAFVNRPPTVFNKFARVYLTKRTEE